MRKLCGVLLLLATLLSSCGSNAQAPVNKASDPVPMTDQNAASTTGMSDGMQGSEAAAFATDEAVAEASAWNETDTAPTENEEFARIYLGNAYDLLTEEPYEDVITKIAPDELVSEYLLYYGCRSLSGQRPDADSIHGTYGIECLRHIGYYKTYSIHKLDSGALLYMFYYDGFLFNSTVMSKALTKADFSEIKIGDPISEVAAIEPTTTYWERLVRERTQNKPDLIPAFQQPLLLKDSLLRISYEMQDGIFYITDMAYHDDFLLTKEDIPYYGDNEWDYTILPEDYPH